MTVTQAEGVYDSATPQAVSGLIDTGVCRSRNLIPDAARSRARQVAAWIMMLLRRGDPIGRDTDSDAESGTNRVGVPGFGRA